MVEMIQLQMVQCIYINIALLPNYAVGKSYNYNQIVFSLLMALVKRQANSIVILIVIYTYFLNSIKNIVRFQYIFQITVKSYKMNK